MKSASKESTNDAPAVWGLMAEYPDAAAISKAAVALREAGYRKWDCYTPYPVHGLDRAMGVRPTILPWLVLAAGLTGCVVALLLQWYVNSPHTESASTGALSGYPLVFSGKPYWSWPAHTPVAFELSVLFASLTAFFGLWGLVRLPQLWHPTVQSRRFRRSTDNVFFIVVESADPKFDAKRTAADLMQNGGASIETIPG